MDNDENTHPHRSSSDQHSTLDFTRFIGPLANSLDDGLSYGDDLEVSNQVTDDIVDDEASPGSVLNGTLASGEAASGQADNAGEEAR